eukprot:Pgem_evm1s4422
MFIQKANSITQNYEFSFHTSKQYNIGLQNLIRACSWTEQKSAEEAYEEARLAQKFISCSFFCAKTFVDNVDLIVIKENVDFCSFSEICKHNYNNNCYITNIMDVDND